MNPCKECIIDIMCSKQCEKLECYIKKLLNYKVEENNNIIDTIGRWSRISKVDDMIIEVHIPCRYSYTSISNGKISLPYFVIRNGKINKLEQPIQKEMNHSLYYYKSDYLKYKIYVGLDLYFENSLTWTPLHLRYGGFWDKYIPRFSI